MSFVRVLGMYPEFWSRVGFGKSRQCLPLVKESMEGCKGAPLAKAEWIRIGCRSCVGWQGRESGLLGTLAPKLDLFGGCGKIVFLVGDMGETILLPVSAALA